MQCQRHFYLNTPVCCLFSLVKGSSNVEDVISPWDSFSAGELHVVLLSSPAEQGANLPVDHLGTVVTVVVVASQSCSCSTGFPADTPCGSSASHTPKLQGLHNIAMGCTGAVGDHVQCVQMMVRPV